MINQAHEKMIQACLEAKKAAYAPYSEFAVGAALLAGNGKIYKGCNIENASFSLTNCAERTAFFKAVSEGVREFEAIAVTAQRINGDGTHQAVFPCGACRQVMAEFCGQGGFLIYIVKSPDEYRVFRLSELFPLGFGPGDLG